MLTPGDVVTVDHGTPVGSEAGLCRPAVVVTATQVLRGGPNVIHIVPLTKTIRPSGTEIRVEPDRENRLATPSSAQCQHLRAVARSRIQARNGNVGPAVLAEIRETIGLLIDI